MRRVAMAPRPTNVQKPVLVRAWSVQCCGNRAAQENGCQRRLKTDPLSPIHF
jgi:hypothetical protein